MSICSYIYNASGFLSDNPIHKLDHLIQLRKGTDFIYTSQGGVTKVYVEINEREGAFKNVRKYASALAKMYIIHLMP